jgi:PadR family transcriptional regulator PadR
MIRESSAARFVPRCSCLATRVLTDTLRRIHTPRSYSGEWAMPPIDEPMLLAGTLDLLVLRTLTWGPRHGYAVAQWINQTSRATIEVEDRALYLSLHRLEERGFVESTWALSENNRRARFYQLTLAGRRQLTAKEHAFARYVDAVFEILTGPERAAP